jgi:hypothetical protein
MQIDDFSAYLLPGEQLVWYGEPQQGLMFASSDILFVPFSLLWGGFAIFWESSVLREHAPFFFKLWGIPFVLVGLYLIVGRFFADAWMRRQTAYALTAQRALIIRRGPWPKTTSLALGSIANIQLMEGAGGRGTIQFGETPFGRGSPFRAWPGTGPSVPSFISIEDARSVFAKIQASNTGARR